MLGPADVMTFTPSHHCHKPVTISSTKHILITGAANGIGRHLAIHFFNHPSRTYSVTLTDIDANRLNSLKNYFASKPDISSRTFIYPGDVSNDSSVKELIQKSVSRFGGLHALINNAGISNPYMDPANSTKPFYSLPPANFLNFLLE